MYSKFNFWVFRYSGWQKQPGFKTIEGMLVKTLKFIVPDTNFKVLGAGRTDAKVSGLDAAFELFIEETPILNFEEFLMLFNTNLPPDIRVMEMREVDANFNIIQDGKQKEYVYLFSFGQKNHPFCAAMLANIIDDLDIELMKKGAELFEGTHNFYSYTVRTQKNSKFRRTIFSSSISENTLLTANFFPEKSYAFTVVGEGFLRYQIRMMMGALIQLGKRGIKPFQY